MVRAKRDDAFALTSNDWARAAYRSWPLCVYLHIVTILRQSCEESRMDSAVGPHSKKKICYYYDGQSAFCIFTVAVEHCGFRQ